MLYELLRVRFDELRTEFKRRGEWPVVEPQPLNPRSPGIWKRFVASGERLALLKPRGLSRDSDEAASQLRTDLGMPANLEIHYGYARPYLLWLYPHDPEAGYRVELPPLHRCTALHYLELEDMIAGWEAIQALLNENN
jgi:hypothetical protein